MGETTGPRDAPAGDERWALPLAMAHGWLPGAVTVARVRAALDRAERIEQAARAHVAAVETPGGPVAPTFRALTAALGAEGDETR